MHGEGHGHAVNKNGSGGPVHVRLAAYDEGGPGFVNISVRTITNARRGGGAVAVQMQKHASTRSGQRGQHNRGEENGQDRGFAKLLKQWRNS